MDMDEYLKSSRNPVLAEAVIELLGGWDKFKHDESLIFVFGADATTWSVDRKKQAVGFSQKNLALILQVLGVVNKAGKSELANLMQEKFATTKVSDDQIAKLITDVPENSYEYGQVMLWLSYMATEWAVDDYFHTSNVSQGETARHNAEPAPF